MRRGGWWCRWIGWCCGRWRRVQLRRRGRVRQAAVRGGVGAGAGAGGGRRRGGRCWAGTRARLARGWRAAGLAVRGYAGAGRRWPRAVAAGQPVPAVVAAWLAGAGAGGGAAAGGRMRAGRCGRWRVRCWGWCRSGWPRSGSRASRLVVVTAGGGGGGAGEGVADLAGAAVWGLVRSAQSENPGRLVLADLRRRVQASWRVLAAAVGSGEPELAVRGAGGARAAAGAGAGWAGLAAGRRRPWRLDGGRDGTLDGLALVAGPQAGGPLGPGQVRVAVRAAGLNFRDVLIALGMYPGAGGDGQRGRRGGDWRPGRGWPGLAAGDRVLGLWRGGFGPVAVADARLLAQIPAGWSFAQAASVPVAFATAWYALVDLAGAAGRGVGCWCTRRPAGWGWRRCSSPGTWARRCSRTASPGKQPVLAGLGAGRRADRVLADAGVRGAVPGRDRRGAGWMSC